MSGAPLLGKEDQGDGYQGDRKSRPSIIQRIGLASL